MPFLRPSQLEAWHLIVLRNEWKPHLWMGAHIQYENLWKDRDRPEARKELEHIHDLFATARLRKVS